MQNSNLCKLAEYRDVVVTVTVFWRRLRFFHYYPQESMRQFI